MYSCTHVPDPAGAFITAGNHGATTPLFLRSSIEALALDVVPTVHAHETHSYRFVVLQVLLVALHAQFCQPSSN